MTQKFSNMEASFAIHMAETFKDMLAERKKNTYSGVDRLLLDSSIIEADNFINKMKTYLPQLEPMVASEQPEG
jgi:hypothetical protein